MEVGNRIIYDQDGEIIVQLGEMKGDINPRKEITKLDYIDLDFGEIDYFKYSIKKVDVDTKQPILEEIVEEETPEEIIQRLEEKIKSLGGEL